MPVSDDNKRQSAERHFILENVDPDTKNLDQIICLYDEIASLYRNWGIKKSMDIELSVKISRGNINYNRYVIPIKWQQARDNQKVYQILNVMNAPIELYNMVETRHKNRISVMVGIDCNKNARRVYFYHGSIGFGYDFIPGKDDIYVKFYRLVNKGEYEQVIRKLRLLERTDRICVKLLNIIPQDQWSEVCETVNLYPAGKSINAYDISLFSNHRFACIKESIIDIVNEFAVLPDKNKLMKWLDRNSDNYLYWIGLEKDLNNQLSSITLYLRREDNIHHG